LSRRINWMGLKSLFFEEAYTKIVLSPNLCQYA
jgi:hypothetical protein